jgi:arylsulfatase
MPADKPNILFIMADQFRHDFLGATGADFVRTPNLDKLASNGMLFRQCATTSPVCAPARIALATGLRPHRTGCTSNNTFLPLSRRTYYQQLRDHGYRVGCVGKLDLAKPDKYNGRYGDRPIAYAWGFTHPEETEGKAHAGTSPTPIGPYTHYLDERDLLQPFHKDYRQDRPGLDGACRDSVLPADAFEDAYIGRRAAKWINEIPTDFPFHYFVSFVGPHDPYDPPTEYAEHFRDAEMPAATPINREGRPGRVLRRMNEATDEQIAISRRQYCASIEVIDDAVGLILESLEQRGLADNTYIVFSSDHGDMMGDHGMWNKHTDYETSLRVPLMVAGPGIEAGSESEALVENMDLNPTLCELAGVPTVEQIDARSFVNVLRDESAEHRDATIAIEGDHTAIRTHTHKYIDTVNQPSELYDLASDPDELTNVIDKQPMLAKELGQRLSKALQEDTWHR